MTEIEFIICAEIAMLIAFAIIVLILICKVRDLEARIDFAIHLNCETERNIERTSDELLKMILDMDNQQDEDNGRVEAAKQMGFLK